MTFASAYLSSGALFPEFIKERPGQNTGLIVVIPAYNEPEIGNCLSSLAACERPEVDVEIIVIVNAPPSVGTEKSGVNKATIENIESWKEDNPNPFFRLFVFDVGQPAIKDWGVGTARKTGMDEAVRRFNSIDKPNGVIVSLDADCEVSTNYFTSLWNDFGLNHGAGGCSIYFEHREKETHVDLKIQAAIRQYELHLRYFVAGLRFVQYPFPFHTVGSAMAVKAFRYVQAGGMSRRQGGEDFYFIQKLVAGDDFINLNNTTVYPSPRLSLRVPFGTGPVISKLISSGEETYMTYNPDSFLPLKNLFDQFSGIAPVARLSNIPYDTLGVELSSFISESEWTLKYAEIIKNTATPLMFTKRFFTWFNAFKIVKYLNAVHLDLYQKVPVETAASIMLQMVNNAQGKESETDLLALYRKIDRTSH
jgi:glycosyltransferase involved in cell wall biosynthesis